MKIFGFVIVFKVFFVGLTILSSFKVKQDQKLLMLIIIIPYFTLLVLKRVNVMIIGIILTIHMQKFVFLML